MSVNYHQALIDELNSEEAFPNLCKSRLFKAFQQTHRRFGAKEEFAQWDA
jgi:hypothetical protein